MPNNNVQANMQVKYDPRWFIWTIAFLIVVGVSLSSYIYITSENDQTQFIVNQPVVSKTAK